MFFIIFSIIWYSFHKDKPINLDNYHYHFDIQTEDQSKLTKAYRDALVIRDLEKGEKLGNYGYYDDVWMK